MHRFRSLISDAVTSAGVKGQLSWRLCKQASGVAAEPFLNGSSSIYLEEMYNSWLKDPKSVHAVSVYSVFLLAG